MIIIIVNKHINKYMQTYITLSYQNEIIIYDIFVVKNEDQYNIYILTPIHESHIWKTRFLKKYVGFFLNNKEYNYIIHSFDKCNIIELLDITDLQHNNKDKDKDIDFQMIIKKKNKNIIIFNNIKINNYNKIKINNNGSYYVVYSDDTDIFENIIKNTKYTDILIFTSKKHMNSYNNIQYIYWNFDVDIIEYYCVFMLGKKYKYININKKIYDNVNNTEYQYSEKITEKYSGIHKPISFCIDNIPIIYDIFISNDKNKIYMIGVNLMNTILSEKNINIKELEVFVDTKKINYNKIKDKSTIIYEISINKYVSPLNLCLKIDKYEKNIIIDMDRQKCFLYFNNSKVLTTIFKDENHLIDSWIDYYSKIGFNLFILYNNNPDNTEYYDYLLKKYNNLIFVDWNYKYLYDETRVSGQTTQQNHALYICKQSECIGMLDLDEYIVSPKKQINILNHFKDDWYNISALSFQTIWFGCGKKINDDHNFLRRMLYRSKYSCGSFCQQKCIINPKNVTLFNVHIPVIYNGSLIYFNSDIFRMNHYFTLSTKNRICDHNIYDEIYDDEILQNL